MKKIISISLFLGVLFTANLASAMLPPPPPPTPPVITLIGNNPIQIYVGDNYIDAGATAIASDGTDISSLITVSGLPVDTSIPGTYEITYNVTDITGIPAVPVTRTVNVVLPPPPPVPTNGDQCKKRGWMNYGDMFKNQGDCVSFVATYGKNPPNGPAK